MKNKSIYDEIFDKPCSVCKEMIKKDVYDQGDCPYCKWKNNFLADENPNRVIYPNLISLNKAIKLYEEGKALRPDINDFLDGLYCYREMGFYYKDLNCCVFLKGEKQKIIEFGWAPDHIYYFKDKEDFIQNAKIENEYVRDIWDKVENPDYL